MENGHDANMEDDWLSDDNIDAKMEQIVAQIKPKEQPAVSNPEKVEKPPKEEPKDEIDAILAQLLAV